MYKNKTKKLTLTIFAITYFVVGLMVFDSYGIPWDEPMQRMIGGVSYKFLVSMIHPIQDPQVLYMPALSTFQDRDYGIIFETPSFALERLLRLEDPRSQYLFRHFLTFLVSSLGVLSIYLIAARRFKDWRIGLFAAILLVLTPRFFAESFYNSKDLLFMAFFAMSINSMLQFVLRPNIRTSLLHALITALTVDFRILGIIIPVGTMILLILRIIKREASIKSICYLGAIYLTSTVILAICFFPYLWESPLSNFLKIIENMAHFRWNGEVLYMGQYIRAASLPWHYAPVWIVITTPAYYLFLFCIGAPVILVAIIKNKFSLWSNNEEMQDSVFLALFISPIAMVIFLHSILYDGWRHLYFIYPAFLLICVRGFVFIDTLTFSGRSLKLMLYGITCCALGYYANWIRVNHPYQFSFFNFFAGHEIRYSFDMDYWGVGNRRALEDLLTKDRRSKIAIYPASLTVLHNSLMLLPENMRARVSLVKSAEESNYVFTNYRNIKESDDQNLKALYPIFHQIKVGSEPIITIYRVN